MTAPRWLWKPWMRKQKNIHEEAAGKILALKNKAAADEEAIAGKIESEYKGAEMIAQGAQDELRLNKQGLDEEVHDFQKTLGEAHQALGIEANESATMVDGFRELEGEEKKNMDANKNYLNGYALLGHSQLLDLLQGVESAVTTQAQGADTRLQQVEEDARAGSMNM